MFIIQHQEFINSMSNSIQNQLAIVCDIDYTDFATFVNACLCALRNQEEIILITWCDAT